MLLRYPDWKRTLMRPGTLILLKIGHEVVRCEMAEDML
jgi:hypothetical protein